MIILAMHAEYLWPIVFVYFFFIYDPSYGCEWEHWVVRPDVFSDCWGNSVVFGVEAVWFFLACSTFRKLVFWFWLWVLVFPRTIGEHRSVHICILAFRSSIYYFQHRPSSVFRQMHCYCYLDLHVLERFGFLFSLSISFLFSLASRYFILVVSSIVHALFLPLLRFSCSFLLFLFCDASSFRWFSISFFACFRCKIKATWKRTCFLL